MPSVQRVPHRLAWSIGLAAVVLTVVVAARQVDPATLRRAVAALARDPGGLALALGGFAAAFVLRSWSWHRVVPGLRARDAWAGIHLSLAANHLLPLRLGEVVRPVATARRTGLAMAPLVASTLTLRAADVLALALLGMLTGPAVAGRLLGGWGVAVLVAVGLVGGAGLWWLAVLRRGGAGVRLPGAAVAGAALGAWALEAVVILRVAAWAGHPVSVTEAVLVTAAAVGAQVAAVAPGGIGTYEAAATAGLVAVGVPGGSALAIALVAHAIKTVYSLAGGAVALWWPAPSLVGRLRLAKRMPARPVVPVADGPVVLVLPALDEADRVGAVVARVPRAVAGRPVRCVVVDDGSTDATAAVAGAAGAEVIGHATNQGLGAALRTGFAHGVALGAAVVAFCDADGEYAPEELDRLVAPVLAGAADYVVGSRFSGRIDHMRPLRRAGNLALTAVLRWVSRTAVTDGQSGYRALSREAAASAEIVHDYNYAQVLTLDLLGKGFRYAEVPITYRFRTSGRSFVRLGRYLRRVVPAVHRELNAPVLDPVHR